MRALISVSDKSGIQSFAKALIAFGYEIISTGGTANVLKQAGIPVMSVDDVTGFPEMMDGRVKTLHPNIHGGLLARRDVEAHMSAASKHHIQMIDLVIVNLYPFESTIARNNVTLADAIEQIDIGGPSMVRSAAKNYQDVAVVVNPSRYETLMDEMDGQNGQLSLGTKQDLALEAFQHTARYDTVIANYLATVTHATEGLPMVVSPVLNKTMDLRYGENPHQQAALYSYSHSPNGLNRMIQHHGKALSYNNMIDLEAAWHIVREFDEPAVAIIKHNNPCGVAISDDLSVSYEKALKSDPVSAFGGIIGCNRTVDKKTAELISTMFVEVVVAPSFSSDALVVLSQKPSIRLIELPNFFDDDASYQLRYVQGGILLQSPNNCVLDDDQLSVVTNRGVDPHESRDLRFAYAVCKHVKSNAIVLVKNGQTVGVGAGQMSRVEAVTIALQKAGSNAAGSVCASDAFFPFNDSIKQLASHGVMAVIQPGGSKRDQESIDACNDASMAMVFTAMRHFKH